ncbi:cytochrome c-type biogenesis protein [Nitrospina gracilis]|uniref:cytochrome c-type biogenesis protein n=1 Tax=Nitrospina gracilis TaxID=35801 RepID=UPI001F1B8C9D|nr:cytochrome c-type biogenesis protein CcmH [Nitrospina gracilis]MCF8720014.1 cytochrome c-type biogenesis protein CcmH [Nitrospina gracilis Nb-211]
MRTRILIAVSFCFWAFSALPVFAATQLENLENALMCTCDDKCGKVLINCSCDHSEKMRGELTKQLESGLTVKQIIQTYVDKHGETVLSAPTKSGFNLTAWITPFVALVIGGFGVRKVIVVWTRKSTGKPGEETAPAQDAATSEVTQKKAGDQPYQSRLKDELDRLET